MKRILTILILATALVGCSADDKASKNMKTVGYSTGDKASTKKKDMKTVCLDGVTYYLFSEKTYSVGYGYMSVKLDKESKIIPCTE